ncbi:NUDIX hydrolase [Pelagibius sp.]|uniref:NUDIX hydrolase n=1 Tax=Pelagibius sp. TaxID=1931238 RepID=UPI003B509CBB
MGRSGPAAKGVDVDLTAVVVSVRDDEPQALVVPAGEAGRAALPSGPLRPDHGTLQAGLRSWVEQQTRRRLGYIEQLYTFGDRPVPVIPDRAGEGADGQPRTLSIAYLALVSATEGEAAGPADWQPWYAAFPWEDWRAGEPSVLKPLRSRLRLWAQEAGRAEKRGRQERARATFGPSSAGWDEERALERYELLYEAALVPEAWHDRGKTPPQDLSAVAGRAMAADHRRILATAISRLRGKIKYRPVLFELLPAEFTLFQLQRTAEALTGARLHKQNFRRLVTQQGLVEETGAQDFETGGRPAKLMRFRRAVTLGRAKGRNGPA